MGKAKDGTNRGRKNKYFSHVRPRFDEIAQMCSIGASDADIIERLGIGKANFYRYLNDHNELRDLIINARKRPVQEIKAALLKRAKGFYSPEIKETIIEKADGTSEKKTEKINRYYPPDVAASMVLLKHWAKDEGWTNDPAALALRKREIEIKEKQAENDNW